MGMFWCPPFMFYWVSFVSHNRTRVLYRVSVGWLKFHFWV